MRRSRPAKQPHQAITKHDAVRTIEQPARDWFHVQKVFLREGEAAALETIRGLTRPENDPSTASAVASVAVSSIGNWIEHAEKFTGRKPGAVSDEIRYLRLLEARHPNETGDGLWYTLRKIAQDADVDCPFRLEFRTGPSPVLVKSNGRPMPKKTFLTRIAEIRATERRHKRGR